MKKTTVTRGVTWVECEEAGLRLLCGAPADVVKHLQQKGLIAPVEREGVRFETGPNAILLSDVPVQNGGFSNLAEFPILHMFYRQGMLIPGHPGNDGRKPILVGLANQLRAQLAYIDLGKTGILDEKSLASCGMSRREIGAFLELKKAFAFGDLRGAEELIEAIPVEPEGVELPGGVQLRRTGLNTYDVSRGDETVGVDMNLAPGEGYEPAIKPPFLDLRREYFSVVHLGEGDGWDPKRPCMGSILVYQGKIYLIDTGPNVVASLAALGLSASDIEGVFQTHAHDDHFAGLPVLARSDHRIRYFSTKLVRLSVTRKACALMDIPESRFPGYFEATDLTPGVWNDLGGLEVMPVSSPHPIETCAFFFRTYGEDGYRSYAHLADIISTESLAKLVESSKGKLDPGIVARARDSYTMPADIKKVDVGGAMIHGSWEDFKEDQSGRIYWSHRSEPLPEAARRFGSEATFGSSDVLIAATQDYTMRDAARFLAACFPEAPEAERYALLSCPVESFAEGESIHEQGKLKGFTYLLVSGIVELFDPERGVANMLPAGTFLGEFAALTGRPPGLSYRTATRAKMLRIPSPLYHRFICRNYKLEEMLRFHEHMIELKVSRVFGDMISSPIAARLARRIRRFALIPGTRIEPDPAELYLIHKGKLVVFIAEAPVEIVGPGGIFGEEGILLHSSSIESAVAETEVEAFALPSEALGEIPTIEWKLLETYELRINAFGAFVS